MRLRLARERTLRGLEHFIQHFVSYLRDQAVELCVIEAEGVLAEASFFSHDVPVGHAAELLAFGPGFEQDQKRIERHFFFLFAEPGFQPFGTMRGHNLEVSVAGAQLEVEIDVQLARSSASRAFSGSIFEKS
jgi:hypothetical protein